ncbi:MAG: DUF559 domain-containing protein [Candidatus Promineifilaceae bacterium]|nr:DUF559 domain-containing protein [Candidatus Promineifilaceae bacterium]
MTRGGEVLVAIMNNKRDWALAERYHWYRIPVSSAGKWLREAWPPEWIAFYMTKAFGKEAHGVHYYARVLDIRKVVRRYLFPSEPENDKSSRTYFQILFEPLKKLPRPILSRRYRRIVFIPTTWHKFANALEINDLYQGSPLEDRLWAAMKRHRIAAEREFFVQAGQQDFALDFAIFCEDADIDVETDGDSYHANPQKGSADNIRNNALEAAGWKVLRFNTQQIQEQLEEYTVPKIVETINSQGGISEGKLQPRRIHLNADGAYQPGLFDDW